MGIYKSIDEIEHEENLTKWDNYLECDLPADRQASRYSGQVMAIEKQL